MNTIKTRVTAVALGLTVSALLAGPAVARPAASFYTPQALEAMSANWAAKGRLLDDPPAASFYSQQQLEAMSSNWAAKGRLLRDRPAPSFYTPAQLEAMSANWAAKGRLLTDRPAASFYTPAQLEAISSSWEAKGRLLGQGVTVSTLDSSGVDLGDVGIGAAAMLGLVLFVGGLGAGVHFSRKSRVRTVS